MNYKDILFILFCLVGICACGFYILEKLNIQRRHARLEKLEIKKFFVRVLKPSRMLNDKR